MNRAVSFLSKLRQALAALVICTLVLGVPLLSFKALGHLFYNGPKRSAAPLAAMQARPVDIRHSDPALFQEPLISVTFDDGFETTYSVVMPLLQKYGIRTTQYVLSGTAKDPAYLSWEQMAQMQKAGHEIACHTATHADLVTLNDKELRYQVENCRQELTQRFGTVTNFASPYGSYNERTIAVIDRNFYSHRNTLGDPKNGVDEYDVNLASNFDRRHIIGVTVEHDTTLDQIKQLVEYAKANNGWLVLTYHQADDPTSKYSLDREAFEKQFAYLAGTDVRIATVEEVLKTRKLAHVNY